MWCNELTLIGEGTTYYDDIGNPISEGPVETTIFCEVNSISRNEFYNASMSDLKPSLIFTIHAYEYNDEEKIKYDEKNYKVIKTYLKNTEELELTCEKVIANG